MLILSMFSFFLLSFRYLLSYLFPVVISVPVIGHSGLLLDFANDFSAGTLDNCPHPLIYQNAMRGTIALIGGIEAYDETAGVFYISTFYICSSVFRIVWSSPLFFLLILSTSTSCSIDVDSTRSLSA